MIFLDVFLHGPAFLDMEVSISWVPKNIPALYWNPRMETLLVNLRNHVYINANKHTCIPQSEFSSENA